MDWRDRLFFRNWIFDIHKDDLMHRSKLIGAIFFEGKIINRIEIF